MGESNESLGGEAHEFQPATFPFLPTAEWQEAAVLLTFISNG